VRVLVVNVGSSSIKGSLVESTDATALLSAEESLGTDATKRTGVQKTVRALLKRLDVQRGQGVDAVGHRVVHGGTRFRSAVRINDRVLKGIEQLAEFAPLHNRVAVQGIRAAQAALPQLPQVAAFDTAFHASLTESQFVYPLPWSWYRRYGIRRFGFHGLSVEWSMRKAAELLRRPPTELAMIVAHLGSGCSVTAVLEGRSVATSMGLTPLEGLMMGTRSGSIDPGILLYMLRTRRAGWRTLESALDHEAGFVGVAGRRQGMRELLAAADKGNRRARLAVDMFVNRTAAGIAAISTALPRVDALVFTGGIGEHSTAIREAVMAALRTVSVGQVLAIEAREDAVVAGQVAALLEPRKRSEGDSFGGLAIS
jgi:acetate kinase